MTQISYQRILPFQDRLFKELRVNEVDSDHIVFVGSVKPTVVTQNVKSYKLDFLESKTDLVLWYP